jgi:hypothetical protein
VSLADRLPPARQPWTQDDCDLFQDMVTQLVMAGELFGETVLTLRAELREEVAGHTWLRRPTIMWAEIAQ